MDFLSQFDPEKHSSFEIKDAIKQSGWLTKVERERLLSVLERWADEDLGAGETQVQARADLLRRLAASLAWEQQP